MSEKPLLEMIGIDKTFGRQTVLKNCSLTVQRGETVVLIGPSAAMYSSPASTSAGAMCRRTNCVSALAWCSRTTSCSRT